MEEMITITRKEYVELILRDAELEGLQRQGVDNWSGYDEAIDNYRELVNNLIERQIISEDEV